MLMFKTHLMPFLSLMKGFVGLQLNERRSDSAGGFGDTSPANKSPFKLYC